MPRNVKLLIAYDGTNFLGWQKTNTGPSIEGALQAMLERILQHPVALQAASRTDAGVHADGQVVNFFTDRDINCGKLQIGVNSLIGGEIAVLEASIENEAFHPTLDAREKEYRYSLHCGRAQPPRQRLYAWHYPHTLDLNLMRESAKALIGRHDFAAFCNFKKNATHDNTIRQVSAIEIEELQGHDIRITVKGQNFLYKMVRNIVGTLVYVGCGKLSPEEIPLILSKGDRTLAGMTAPAHGLTLYRVCYKVD